MDSLLPRKTFVLVSICSGSGVGQTNRCFTFTDKKIHVHFYQQNNHEKLFFFFISRATTGSFFPSDIFPFLPFFSQRLKRKNESGIYGWEKEKMKSNVFFFRTPPERTISGLKKKVCAMPNEETFERTRNLPFFVGCLVNKIKKEIKIFYFVHGLVKFIANYFHE